MSRDKGNPIAGFGHQFVEADRIIQTNMARLRQPPLGPVGQYIKVKPGTSQQELTLINSHQPLTRLLRSYVVATPEDERTLRSILPRNHNPTIYYVKPDNYDVDRISPSSQFKTILRCLDISEARVIQALVEWATVHGTAIAGSTEEAVRALKQGAQNLESAIAPHKTSERFIVTATQRGSQLSSSGVVQSGLLRVGKAIVTGEDVSEAKKRVAVCERELQPLKEEFRRLEQEEQMALREFRSLDEKESVFEQKLQSLKKEHAFAVAERDTIPDAPSTDETDQAIEIKTQELDNSKQQLSETREALEAAKQRSREIANSETEAEVELDKLNAKVHEKFLATEEANLRYTAHQDVVTSTLQKFELAKKKLAEKEVELVDIQANMETQLAAAQALSEELVPLDEGVDLENGFDYCTKRTGELQAKIDAAKTRNLRDYRIVYAEFQEAEEAYRLAKEEFEAQKKDVRALGDTEADRVRAKGQALAFGIMQTSSYFGNIMKSRAASADVVFDLNTRKLEVKNYKLASTSDASSKGGARDVATTSGGEHSFLQSALMAALWQMVDAPIICLDEYEVFMDDTTRVTAQKNLINTLGGLRQCVQAIFISPTVVKNSAVDDARFTYVEVRDPSFASRNR
ncbi:YALI0A01602p [Yarrowia lipolytica CLIB122]|uniref:YALI0A01602p n=1 Tax=Yarrowia lipolytica (strain CLIB 122 / E 150) TaxID=284591 RepID=W0TYQ3_YARLI|nr:YALI0A01602p [Yarrowia lipolytica CLIB122]CAG83580.4 YALI0A01602p [Yarrowia lipolytica CLIB122]|eukprot:XP_002142981.1 YALI0A01602p [Yarrowia lipolytica CLIB122]